MVKYALSGDKKYWYWMGSLAALIFVGFICYLGQYSLGLGITGMSRDVSWGIYISQFTFFVGVAASAVMVVLPYYLHNYKAFANVLIFGEFLAISAVIMCILFIFVDLGQPTRAMNVLLYPTPYSIMFWNMIMLSGYLFLNVVVGWVSLRAKTTDMAPPKWVKPLIYLSIPWAFSIHTVTAFLYSGLPGRHFWLTAIMAARFLASAFSSGPALLLILAFVLKKRAKVDIGKEAVNTLSIIITYAMLANVFFLLLELFTAFYSGIPGHSHPFTYLYSGLHGHSALVPLMWLSTLTAIASLVLLLIPSTRKAEKTLITACALLFVSLFIDKGFGLVIGGFIPNAFGNVVEYWPSIPEILISLGIWAIGAFILTALYKMAIGVSDCSRP